MKPYKTEISFRKFDRKHVLWGLVMDPNYTGEVNDSTIQYIHNRWVMLGIHDAKKQAEDQQKQIRA